MNCRWEGTIVDAARTAVEPGADVAGHLEECDACAARYAVERRLTAGLRALAASGGGAADAAAIEARLMATFAGMASRRPSPYAEWRSWVAAAAAIATLSAGVSVAWQEYRRVHVEELVAPAGERAGAEFTPWPGASTLPAFESGQLVRTELPVSVLPLLGIVPAATVEGNTILADVLVGQDGLARAVRLVQ